MTQIRNHVSSSFIGSFWTAQRVTLNRPCQIAALGLLLGTNPLMSVAAVESAFEITMLDSTVELLLPVSGGERSLQAAQAGVGRQPIQLNRMLNKMPLQSTARFSMTRGVSYEVVYDHRIDHPSGNMTWVGSIKNYGDDYRAIITFGEGGASGRIVTPEGEFLVETDADGEWLIDTQAAGLAMMGHSEDDAVIPLPEDIHKSLHRDHSGASDPASDESQSTESLVKNNPLANLGNVASESDHQAAIATDTALTNVDVMILYTPGLASRLGSGLSARLDQLVALSNQAYRDSGVYINLRMVHSQQVNYSDATTNSAALNALTYGSDPALADIANLRTMKGADLVSLVRPFNKEASGGSCGIAWIIGAGGNAQSIPSYSSRGYSVVSDGKDVNNSGYYCTDLTFTHELGHNMGLAHDRANASSQGAYPYSYGYGVAGSFGTVMSYTSPRIGKFSNPAITCAGGIACGVSETAPNSANNGLSLNNTRYAIAGFRNEQQTTATASYTLTVSKSGNGAIVSNLVGINCGSDCTEAYASGTSVTLTATPAAGSTFAGWSGACVGTSATCTVPMTATQSVSATFNQTTTSQYVLQVLRNGEGAVTSSLAGINCGSDCAEAYTSGTSVTLTATPAAGSTFAGWSGACAGTSTACSVPMIAAQMVVATFNQATTHQYLLQVVRSGEGAVTSNLVGINCGSDCSEAYASGTSVTLTATPAAGYAFAGWSGACAGTSTACTVPMTAAQSVTATFKATPTANQYTLHVVRNGEGVVTSSPAGINCGGVCSASFANSSVGISVTPANGYTFGGYNSSCANNVCTVTITFTRLQN